MSINNEKKPDEKVPFTEVSTFGRVGQFYESGNGQLVFDSHASDEEHLTSPATRKGQPCYDCRVYAREFIPKVWIGKRGTLVVNHLMTQDGQVAAVSLSFLEGIESKAKA